MPSNGDIATCFKGEEHFPAPRRWNFYLTVSAAWDAPLLKKLPRATILGVWQVTPVAVFIVALMWIFGYGYFMKPRYDVDPLRTQFASCCGCDFWALLHVLQYFVLGFLFPGHHMLFTSVGIFWELMEGTTRQMEVQKAISPALAIEKYWYGRVSDIAFNAIGLLFGEMLSSVLRHGWLADISAFMVFQVHRPHMFDAETTLNKKN